MQDGRQVSQSMPCSSMEHSSSSSLSGDGSAERISMNRGPGRAAFQTFRRTSYGSLGNSVKVWPDSMFV